jgi:hypothetical protein
MCLIFLIGTIFPQGESIEDYINAGGKYVTIVRALNLLDIFVSPLFIIVTCILLINLAICLFDRFRVFVRIKRKPMDFQTLKNHPNVVTFNNTNIENRLKKIGFRLKAVSRKSGSPRVKVYEKGLPYWWLSWFYHVGIILAIIGFFLTALFAFEKDVLLYPGEPETISLYSKDTRWNRLLQYLGRENNRKQSSDTYILTLKEFRTEYYQGLKIDYPGEKLERFAIGVGIKNLKPSKKEFSYMPKMWLTRLKIQKPDGTVLDAELKVNKPFRTGSLTLYQMGYEQKVNLVVRHVRKNALSPSRNSNKVSEEIREIEVRKPFKIKGVKGKFVLGTLRLGTLYKRDGTTEKIVPVTTVYYIPEGNSQIREELGKLRIGESLEAKDVIFEFRDFKEASYLSYRKDPGVWLVGFASLFVFLGLVVRSFGIWYRVQYGVESKIVYALISTRGILADKDRIVKKLGR